MEADTPATVLPAMEAATSLVEAAQPAAALSTVPWVLQFRVFSGGSSSTSSLGGPSGGSTNSDTTEQQPWRFK